MNYKILLTGITNKQFEDICENWYSRLNRLKQYIQQNPDSLKATLLVNELIERMSILTPIYIQYKQMMTPAPKFPKGGIVYADNK